MAMIEDAVILFKNIDENFIKHHFGGNQLKNNEGYTVPEYKCTIYPFNDCYISDSLDFAVDIDNKWILDAYGENKLTFEFIEHLLENTSGDFMFLDDYEIVFERRNGLLIAVDSNDHFHTCSFKNCYDLLKTKHFNGFHDDYGLTVNFHDDIDGLKRVLFDLVKQSVSGYSNVKLIEYDVIPKEFALTSDFFSITVSENEVKKGEYYIVVHYSYSDSLKDCRNQYLRNLFSILFESFNISEEEKAKLKQKIGNLAF